MSGQLNITITSTITFCDHITSKRLSLELVQITRREELELMDKLAVLQVVPVKQCWSETNAKPIGTKWIDINQGDGNRVEFRSRLVATEPGKNGSLVRRRLQCDTTIGRRATLDEVDDD